MVVINSLWIGERLGAVHAACLRSFVKHGHDVVLHSYGRPIDTPEGVRMFDARRLMNESEIVRHKNSGSLALASDIYRYRILNNDMGMYVDCDVYCVRPFDFQDYLFGYEYIDKFNCAVLNLPAKSPVLKSIMDASEDPFFIPPWIKYKKKIRDKFLKRIGLGRPVSERKWGVIGPDLLTYYVKHYGLDSMAQAVDAFYPLHHDHIALLWSEGLGVDSLITKNTYGVHLYNSFIEKMNKEILPDTPLYEIINS